MVKRPHLSKDGVEGLWGPKIKRDIHRKLMEGFYLMGWKVMKWGRKGEGEAFAPLKSWKLRRTGSGSQAWAAIKGNNQCGRA